MSLRVIGPLSTSGPELVVTVPAAKRWTLQALAGTMEGVVGTGRRTLVLQMLSEVEAGNVLFRSVLFDGNGPMNDVLISAAVGWPAQQRDDLGNPHIVSPLPSITLPADAILRFDAGGASLDELFILVDEQ